jgi:tetratricopeptide (TPR) repeat protein
LIIFIKTGFSMRKALFSSLLIIILVPSLIFAQRDTTRATFLDAESWFLFEEYAEALPVYQSMLEQDPGNDNLKYKIGICLLNDPYQRDKSIRYLLEACNNINPAYKEGRSKERSAPPEALYYLGNAYLANELLDSAIESFEKFLDIMDLNVFDEELVLAQISACNNAKRLMTMPVDIDLTLLDTLINTRYADIDPVVSGDGTKMAYVTRLPFYDGAFYTEKTGEGWSRPRLITRLLGYDADIYPVALSYDGTEMILYYDDDYIGNLYYSRFEDGLWTPATKLGENISTKYWESNACFSKDGKTLYFTSNRKGTNGGLDIYRSELQPDGSWGEPVNLGTTINTRYNEECPYISEDGQTLYFSSYGHYNMGGYDIFYSRKNGDGSWAEPVNMGYPINTTDDDLFFQPVNNGKGAYYALYRPGGTGRHDIYYMTIYSADNPRFYTITGNLSTAGGGSGSSPVAVYVIDTNSGDTILVTSASGAGEFSFQVEQGLYALHFREEGYEEVIRPLQVTASSNKNGIRIEEIIELKPVEKKTELYEGKDSKIQLQGSRYEGVVGKPLLIPVTAPGENTVIVRTYQDAVLISADTVLFERRKTDLEISPLPGISEIELEMIDKDGNLHRNRFTVTGIVPVPEALQNEGGTEEIEAEQAVVQVEPGNGEPTDTMRAMVESPDTTYEADSLSGKIPEYNSERTDTGKPGWLLPLFIIVGAGLIWFLIAWWRRRKKREEKGG